MKTRKVSYYRIDAPGLVIDGTEVERITIANAWIDVRLHSVDADGDQIGDDFRLPSDATKIRELAKALNSVAKEIEKWRVGEE